MTKQVHPSLPMYILNYSNKAQFLGKWSDTERICRGLIVEEGTDRVIARGPSKFFNYGQTGAPEVSLEDDVIVTRKEDGSLGIGWTYDAFSGVATRGSFASDQAIHANERVSLEQATQIKHYAEQSKTAIFEIVYPDNRIVLNYGDRDELIPIGFVSNESGLIVDRPSSNIIRLRTTLADALATKIPGDEEGYVLDVVRHGEVVEHVKLKGEEYKILHGLLTNTNARRIWVQLAARDCHQIVKELAEKTGKNSDKLWATYVGGDPEDFKRVKVDQSIEDTLLTNVPDEFYDWVTKKIDSLRDQVDDLIIQAVTLAGRYSFIEDKKSRFEAVKDHVLCTEIIRYMDTRDASGIVLQAWKLVKPEGDDTPFKIQED